MQNLEETKCHVGEALLLACVFIYLILASLFGSFFQPLTIMLALPLRRGAAELGRVRLVGKRLSTSTVSLSFALPRR